MAVKEIFCLLRHEKMLWMARPQRRADRSILDEVCEDSRGARTTPDTTFFHAAQLSKLTDRGGWNLCGFPLSSFH